MVWNDELFEGGFAAALGEGGEFVVMNFAAEFDLACQFSGDDLLPIRAPQESSQLWPGFRPNRNSAISPGVLEQESKMTVNKIWVTFGGESSESSL